MNIEQLRSALSQIAQLAIPGADFGKTIEAANTAVCDLNGKLDDEVPPDGMTEEQLAARNFLVEKINQARGAVDAVAAQAVVLMAMMR